MPLYEYYCQPCNGIFEELRPMRESSEPVPCPECFRDAARIMPTSFSAFTFREGYPRRIPDDGKYYHLEKKVSRLVTSGKPNEHPEVNKPEPKPKKSKGQRTVEREMQEAAVKGQLSDVYGNAIRPEEVTKAIEAGRGPQNKTPNRMPD